MSALALGYNLKNVFLVIGGVPVSGYGEDGGIEVEWSSPIGEVSVGATGLTVFSKLNDNDARVSITVSERSRTYLLLSQLMQIQERSPVLIPLPCLLCDNSNGDQLATAGALFLERPGWSKGRTAGERTFVMHWPNAATTALYGVQNLLAG